MSLINIFCAQRKGIKNDGPPVINYSKLLRPRRNEEAFNLIGGYMGTVSLAFSLENFF